MQFYKKTRSTNFNFLSLFVKLLIIAAIIIILLYALGLFLPIIMTSKADPGKVQENTTAIQDPY